MIAVGVVCNPLEFCKFLKQNKQKFSINKINHVKNIVCTSFQEFKSLSPLQTKKRVIIFDAIEKLKTIQNIVLLQHKSPEQCAKKAVLQNEHVKIKLINHDYIRETLDKNNDESISFLHEYNTNLYNITSVPIRESIRTLYFNYLHGRISKENFAKDVSYLKPNRGKSLIAFENLLKLTESNLFNQTIKAIQASKNKHDRELDKIASDLGIAAFDLRYFLYSNK